MHPNNPAPTGAEDERDSIVPMPKAKAWHSPYNVYK